MIKNENINIANILTLSRIILGIIFLLLFLFIFHFNIAENLKLILKFISILIFIIAIITDGLDGYFARKNKEITDFGKHFDPLADSLFFIIVFFTFLYIGIMPIYFFLIILVRELFMHIFLRPFLKKKGSSLPANIYGKLKTVFQSIFSIIILSFLFLLDLLKMYITNKKMIEFLNYGFDIMCYIFFTIITILSVVSLFIYLIQQKSKLLS